MAGKSVMTYQPGYYKNDYKPIGAIQNSLSLWAMEQENIAHQGMYNGNISWMETDLKLFKTPQAMLYKYDQLNRITKSRSLEFSNNTYLERKGDKKYDEDYSYDANGNILTLKRHDDKAELADDFNYSYYANSNKLEKHKTTGNTYEYDAIGNLVKDYNEKVEIAWTPSGKVRSVTKSDGTHINFRYDATGNRIAKIVSSEAKTDTTIYVRDAGGNVMSIYNNRGVSEVPIYGSSRIGEYMGKEREGYQTFNLRRYEIANHLNVLAVISDKVNLYSSGRIVDNKLVCDSARATVLSANDYYPGGLPMPGREFSSSTYRYGFNGQEKVDEIAGGGNHYTAEFWEYSPRVVTRWNIDPVVKEWESPYAINRGNSIWFQDPQGNDPSTHTDEDGNVIAVKDDGDLGVYRHEGKGDEALKNFNQNYNPNNTSAGGTKMGETFTPLGFADFDAYEKDGTVKPAELAKIDFNSNWATDQVNRILNANPSLGEYANKAREKHEWDIKAKTPNGNLYYGSKLFGKYASARDAGNFAAGAVAQKSRVPNLILDYGFGTYNMSGNSVAKSLFLITADAIIFRISPAVGAGSILYKAKYGEDKFTRMGIEAGKEFIKK